MTAEPKADHGIILHTSNRLESLADRLSSLIRSAPAAPLEPEVIIVQSQGMARWLQLELASRLGLCAHVRFPFPRAFALEVFQAFTPRGPASATPSTKVRVDDLRMDAARLIWPVWSLLPWLADQPGAGAIQRYIAADPDGRKRYQLARRIARLFDDYAIFRPDMVLAWDEGKAGGVQNEVGGPAPDRHPWQPVLWRKLGEIVGPNHAARQHARCITNLAAATCRPPSLPRRVSLFGISSLPPFHVDLFERLGPWCSVHCFLLQPAAVYWGDVTSAKATLRQAGRAPAGASDLHRHEGNPLVASLGSQGRDFLNVLLAQTEFNNLDAFEEPGHDSLLHCVQSDILHLRNPARPESAEASDAELSDAPQRAVRPDDDSIRVHSCHSALRELEVLRDHLLHWLETDPTLAPRDILVMTPDIEAYAPLIDAVFADIHGQPRSPTSDAHWDHEPGAYGSTSPGSDFAGASRNPPSPPRGGGEGLRGGRLAGSVTDLRVANLPVDPQVLGELHANGGHEPATAPPPPSVRIPYSVADRGSGSQSQIVATFVRILHLSGSRLGAASVIELLETAAVRRRFALTEAEAVQVREWLRMAGVRWGRDEAHRAALDLPALRANTWAEGLDRLLLGFAMDTAESRLFEGIQPCAGAEGQTGDTLARLLQFVQSLFATLAVLEQKHSLSEWVAILRRLVTDFFAANEADEPELRLLREILTELAPAEAPPAGATIDEPFPLSVLLEHLEPILADDRMRGGFLTGRITFGALKPMRSIPFRIICLLGLNDAAFPRTDPRLGFDRMASEPRLGDQSKREDDRYLFLETLLSARDRLHLSYVGQSIRDNSPAPPSVLVSELLDYIDQGYRPISESGSGANMAIAATSPISGSATKDTAIRASSLAPGSAPALAPFAATGRGRAFRKERVPPNQLSFELVLSAVAPGPPAASEASPGSGSGSGSGPEPVSVGEPTGEATASPARVSEQLIYRHRLQAFSADYFGASVGASRRLFSYSQENCRAARALRDPAAPMQFVAEPLPEPGAEWRTVDLNLLADFFAHPAQFFLTRRLDIRLPRPEAELSEREPMVLGGLEKYALKDELLDACLAGRDLAALRPVFLASGRLPLGPLGEVRYRELCEGIEEFRERLTRYRPAERVEIPDLDLSLGPFRIIARFRHVTSLAVLNFRPAGISPKDRIRAWVRHVAWCAGAPSGLPRLSVVIGEPSKTVTSGSLQYRPLDVRAARGHLARLLDLYWRGLSEPLRFFPRTSLKFAEIDFYNADRGPNAWRDSLKKARVEWESGRFNEGEEDDDHFRICFQHFDPLEGDFMALARQIGHPLVEHEERA